MSMSSSLFQQLRDFFPHIEEEFLSGLSDVYGNDGTSIEEIIDLVLNYESPPLKTLNENTHAKNDSLDQALTGCGDLQVEINEEPICGFINNLHKDNDMLPSQQVSENLSIQSNQSAMDVDYKDEAGDANPSFNLFESILVTESENYDSLNSTLPLSPSHSKEGSSKVDLLEQLSSKDTFQFNNELLITPNHEKYEESSPLLEKNNTENFFLASSEEALEKEVLSVLLDVLSAVDDNQTNSWCSVYHSTTMGDNSSNKLFLAGKPSCDPDSNSFSASLVQTNRPRDSLDNKESFDSIAHCSSQFGNAKSRLSLLKKVLPDCDWDYLIAQSGIIKNNEELLVFMSQALDRRDYPKRKNPEESGETLRMECTVDDFLKAIPDPEVEFSSESYIRSGYKENAEIYLQSRYKEVPIEVLKDFLARYRYNITKVCHELDVEGFTARPYCLDRTPLHHAATIFFQQEVWYIEHKTEIHDYLNGMIEAVKVEEEMNKPPPPAVDEVFECGICSDDIVEYSKLGTCDGPTGHLFCKECIKRHTEIKIGEGVTRINCLWNCGGYIPLQIVQEVLPPNTFSILMSKIQEEEIRAANIPGVETCPFCPYAYGPDEDDVFLCMNPACGKTSCRMCRKPDHRPAICDMFKEEDEESARHFIENKMTDALVRECYNCGKGIIKSGGCNKMTCTCGSSMCYVCRQPIRGYSHFDRNSKCANKLSNAVLHDRPVAASAQEAFNQLMANNPGLNLDPSKIIPK